MAQGNRPDRVAEEIRHVISETLSRDVKDPGIGFVTITAVKVSSDLGVARISYTTMGDEKNKAATKAAIERVKPFLRRQLGAKMRLRRVPELNFHFDEGIAHQARVEEILIDIQKDREANPYVEDVQASDRPTSGRPTSDVPEDGTLDVRRGPTDGRDRQERSALDDVTLDGPDQDEPE